IRRGLSSSWPRSRTLAGAEGAQYFKAMGRTTRLSIGRARPTRGRARAFRQGATGPTDPEWFRENNGNRLLARSSRPYYHALWEPGADRTPGGEGESTAIDPSRRPPSRPAADMLSCPPPERTCPVRPRSLLLPASVAASTAGGVLVLA